MQLLHILDVTSQCCVHHKLNIFQKTNNTGKRFWLWMPFDCIVSSSTGSRVVCWVCVCVWTHACVTMATTARLFEEWYAPYLNRKIQTVTVMLIIFMLHHMHHDTLSRRHLRQMIFWNNVVPFQLQLANRYGNLHVPLAALEVMTEGGSDECIKTCISFSYVDCDTCK